MRRWQRPYSLDTTTAAALLGLVPAGGFTAFFVIALVRGAIPVPLAVFGGATLAAGAAAAVRQAMLGVYVSDAGVRSRSLLRTTTVPWASVADIRSGTATVAGLDMGRVAIVIDRTDGAPVQTPLQRGEFLRPFLIRPDLGRLATWPEHYDEILATLRAHHRDARRGSQPAPTERRDAPAGGPAQASATGPRAPYASAGAGRTGTAGDAAAADRRRDIHALTRQHQRGALTDAEFTAALARLGERGPAPPAGAG